MKEFTAKGRLTLDGVNFYLFAKDEATAKQRFEAGEYEAFNDDRAEVVDAVIDGRVEENK